jgi:hypothetical protein
MRNSIAGHKQHFIEKLNQRACEYAEFNYGEDGPEFAFTRYLAFCMREVMDKKDVEWVIDLMMSIEAPEAVDMVENTMRNLFEAEPRPSRTRKSMSGD